MPPPIMPNPTTTTTTTTSSSSSSFRGVRKRRWGSWVAEIREPRTRSRIWLGSYPSASAAARAFDAAAFCLRGPSARLNLPHLLLNLPLSLLPPPVSPSTPASRLSPNSIRRVAHAHAHAHATSTANSYNCGSLTNGIHVDRELCTPSMSQELVHPGKSSQPPVRSSRLMINQEDPDDPPDRIESPFRSSQPLIDEHSIDPPEESQLADSSEDNQDSPRSCDIIKISPPNPAIRPQKSSEIRRCRQTATISARRKLSVPDVRCPAVGPSDTAGSRGELGDHDVASSGWLARASLEISPSPTFEQIVAAMAPDAPHHPGHEGSEPGDCADVAPSESLSLWNYW